MAVSTFNITLDTVRQYSPGLPKVLDSTTYPTDTMFDEMLYRIACGWCALLESQLGIDPAALALQPLSQSYGQMQTCICLEMVYTLTAARERASTELLDNYQRRIDDARKRLLTKPASIGDAQPKQNDSPNLFTSQEQLEGLIAEGTRDSTNLGRKLAWRGRL